MYCFNVIGLQITEDKREKQKINKYLLITKEVQMPYCHGAILFCHILAKFGKMP
jgi:hypothetical protein